MHLLNFLLNYFLSAATMFFAAGSVFAPGAMEGGGDGGATDSGGDAGGTDSGDTSGGDDTSSTGGDDAGASDGSRAEGDQDAGERTDAATARVDIGDGRSVPAKVAKLFELAKGQGLEKEVRQLYFADQRLKKTFPGGVNDAIALATSIEQVGGLEGIEQLQSDLEIHQADAELFESNQAKWIENAFAENPEAALASFDRALEHVSDQNPEHYDHVMAKIVLDTLDNGSPITTIYNLLVNLRDGEGNPLAPTQNAARELARWYNAVKDLASKVPEKKVDAQQKALSDREAQVEQREMGTRYTQVNAEVYPVMKSQVVTTLGAEAKAVGIDLKKLQLDYPGAYNSMLSEIQKQIMQVALKDQRFVDKHYALVKKGDLKRAAAAVNAKHDKIIPDIVRSVAQASGLLKGKKKAAGTDNAGSGNNRVAGNQEGNANSSAGWTRVAKAPERSTVNWHKTSSAMQLDGKYILNDGKKVQVHY